MDFSRLDTRKSSETARPLHLRWQHNGNPILNEDGKPAVVMVLGSQARSVHDNIIAEARAKMADAADTDDKDEREKMMAGIQDMMIKGAGRVIDSFQGVMWNGAPLGNSDEDKAQFLDLNFISVEALTKQAAEDKDGRWLKPSFAQQVLFYSNEVAHFLDEELLALSSPPRNGGGSTASRKSRR